MTQEIRTITKAPADFTKAELDQFEALVAKGEEVGPGLRARMMEAETLTMLYAGHALVGTAALKHPGNGYRASVFGKSKSSADAEHYELELGWVFIDAPARGRHLTGGLIDDAMRPAKGRAVYATTRDDNGQMHTVLSARGFQGSGETYDSEQHDGAKIALLLRSERENTPE